MINPRQNEFLPDYASPPGVTLQEMISMKGMTQTELATRLGLTRKTVNEIIKGKAPITPETAIILERVLGSPASFWNTREQQYRETIARIGVKKMLVEQVSWLNEFPVKELIQRHWLPAVKDKQELVQGLLTFFGVASSTEWEKIWRIVPVAYRKSNAFPSKFGSLAAWLRIGELHAHKISCAKYDERKLKQNLLTIRSLTIEVPQSFEPKLKELCAESGIALALVSELQQTRVSGAIRWLNPHKAIIQLSLRYKTDDQFWFTFFHEAGHVLLHSSKELFLEGIHHEDNKESEANAFAENLLIPFAEYQRFRSTRAFSKENIRSFARKIGIAPGIVVGRLQHDGALPRSHCNDLKRHFTLKEE